jgi:hypothetical protein
MEKLAETYPVVPTPKKNPNAIEFAFRSDENKWAATNVSIAKFDLTDGGKIIEDLSIHCERGVDEHLVGSGCVQGAAQFRVSIA